MLRLSSHSGLMQLVLRKREHITCLQVIMYPLEDQVITVVCSAICFSHACPLNGREFQP